MEHTERLSSMLSEKGVILDNAGVEALARYGMLIVRENRHFNLTGYKNISDILAGLIVESIIPLDKIHVPRGTVFCDLGTGAGAPGVPLAVMRPDMRAVLVDSSAKKCEFIQHSCEDAGISGVEVLNARAEELGHDSRYREVFGLVVSRAMGSPYIVIETGGPLVKQGGLLYIYSSITPEDLGPAIRIHAEEMGLDAVKSPEFADYGVRMQGLLFIKKRPSPEKYPRRFAVIKRDAGRIDQQ